MNYKEYCERESAILQKKADLLKEHQEIISKADQELKDLANQYLGVFAIGKPVRFKGEKYFVQDGYYSIHRKEAAVTIRKAKKDGLPSVNGAIHYYVDITKLEAWNEL